jgi:Protein of unknown function (DUF3363)
VPTASGGHVAGTYRQRLALTSGRFAMIDNGPGFALVPWTPALEKHLGRHVSGIAKDGGGIEWGSGAGADFGKKIANRLECSGDRSAASQRCRAAAAWLAAAELVEALPAPAAGWAGRAQEKARAGWRGQKVLRASRQGLHTARYPQRNRNNLRAPR